MSHQPGAYLGGIRTVDDLRWRCWEDHDTGCWHWRLSFAQGSPKVHFCFGDKRLGMRGRRAALTIARGRMLPRKLQVWATDDCESDDCVNPAHCRSGTRAQHGAYMRRTGRSKTAAKTASALKAAERLRKLTLEQVREIRDSSETVDALAHRMGVSRYAVWCARVGKTWRDTAANASVFTWRPQAA